MNVEDFERIFDDVVERSRGTLVGKRMEYAGDEEVFVNFIRAGALQDKSKMAALAGMMAKHTVSVFDMAESDILYDLEKWREKIGDHINYLILLMAMAEEEYSERFYSTSGDISVTVNDQPERFVDSALVNPVFLQEDVDRAKELARGDGYAWAVLPDTPRNMYLKKAKAERTTK